jgi:predicted molibdopterin-dependent oxidoreductase YjgC
MLDRFPRRLSTLENQAVQLRAVDDAVVALKVTLAAESGLADGELVVVHHRVGGIHVRPRLGHLGDLAVSMRSSSFGPFVRFDS